mgnify:CR=1 FL=1
MRRDEEITRVEMLGQRWSGRDPIIKDYACNVYADKIVALDILIKRLPEGSRRRRVLEEVREILLAQGQALWIMQADTFTQLAIKVGSTVRKISGKKHEDGA